MKKSDLKTGMLVELRRGDKAWVLKDTIDGDWIQWDESACCLELDWYNQDLTYGRDCYNPDEYDVVKVYSPIGHQHLSTKPIKEMKVIYEREERLDITMNRALDILDQYFGCDVRIIE